MNKTRRKDINHVISNLNLIADQLEIIKSEEEMAFDNMPENLQCSARGEESEEALNILDESVDSLREIIDNLEEIV